MIASSITALLDASLALNRAFVHVWVDVFTYPTTIADVRRAVLGWCSQHAATLEINTDLRSHAVVVDGLRVAVLFEPHVVDEPKTVLEMPL